MTNIFKNIIISYLLLYILLFLGCSPTTELTRLNYTYKPVIPERARFTANFQSNVPVNGSYYYGHHQERDDEPNIEIKVEKEVLVNRVYTKYYSTKRNDKKTGEALGGIALAGLGGGLIVLGSNSKDSTTKLLGIIGGVVAGIGGLALMFKSAPVDNWTTDSVVAADTMYSSNYFSSSAGAAFNRNTNQNISSFLLSIENLINKKTQYIYADNNGIVQIDLRKYADQKKYNTDIPVQISYSQIQPCKIIIPGDYIKRVMDNEDSANKLNNEAESKISAKKYLEALNIYNQLINKYPNTSACVSAKDKLVVIRENAKKEVNESLIKKLNAVSTDKVPNAIDNAGISSNELNGLGYRIQYISYSQIYRIMIEGLGFMMENNDAVDEFNRLNNSQKIYAVLLAAEKLGGPKANQIIQFLNIDETIANKLAVIKSENLLTK